jgi:magnesium and cobalt transporter
MAQNTVFDRMIRSVFKSKNDNQSLKQAIEDLMDDHDDQQDDDLEESRVSVQERLLISNILTLREESVDDVMIPRADIIAVDVSTTQQDLMALLAEYQFSRIPVYRDQLDDILGTIHIKDILAQLAKGDAVVINDLIRPVPIVSPSMGVLDLILFMKEKRKHMVMVIDEYGGIDGLVTVGDVIETIVGEIEDEYNQPSEDELVEKSDGTLIVNGRVDLDEFEEKYGQVFSKDEHEDADTLAGLVFATVGRVPARGEIIQHDSGLEFEILDATPRHINRMKISQIDKILENTDTK